MNDENLPTRNDGDPQMPALQDRAGVDERLVAAAPELYALACRVARHFADTDAPLGVDARALLAKVNPC